MRSIADQYRDKNGHLELEKVEALAKAEALASLEQQHRSEVSLIQVGDP
jgi:hypothetical protein